MRNATPSTSRSRSHRRGARFGRRSGNAVLDLAFVLPVLLALTMGAVEYGYALFVKHALQGAAREGARAAIVNGATAATVQQQVDAAMLVAGFPQAKYTRPPVIETIHNGAITSGMTAAVAGDGIRVTVQATWSVIGVDVLPTWMGGIDPNKVLSGATMMRKEG